MADRKLTLLELHLHSNGGVQMGPRTVSTGGEPEPEPEAGGGLFPGPRPVLVALLVGAAAVAAAAWRARRGRPDATERRERPERI